MDYLQNHIWCSDSNWGGHYDCRHLVSLSAYGHDKEDWENLVDARADSYKDEHLEEVSSKLGHNFDEDAFLKYVPNLRPELLRWLEANVKDRKDPDCTKGWCIGSVKYRSTNSTDFTVFFHRKSDAMKFVKTFSKWKKPVNYCQYFSDVRKKLNLETLKYEE